MFGWIAILLGVSLGLLAFIARLRRDHEGKDVRIDGLERERRSLLRRLDVAGATESNLATLGRRIVAAVSAEAGAPVVVLHVAPAEEPFALEAVAAMGISSVGLSSPVAAREVLMSGIPIELELGTDDKRLVVRSSAATITPRHILFRPVKVADNSVGVLEIGLLGPLPQSRLDSLDELVTTCAPAISHVLANDYARRLSSEVRQHAATVADVTTELDTVFEALADGLAVTDDNGDIVRINAAGREILGIAQLDDASSRRTLTDASNPLLQALTEGASSGLEVAVLAADGSRRIVQVNVSPLSSDPKSRASVAAFRSVTRERQLERELRAQSKQLETHVKELEQKQRELERVTRLKSDFLANMSHELRTPLNAVIGFAEVLLDGTYGTLNPKQVECTRDVLAGGRHLLGLINDILDLSKIEAGKMELEREDLDLAEVVSQALTLVRPQATAKKILLMVDVPPSLWVHADAHRLRQVMVNLLSNAVKFTPEKGTVGIDARELGNDLLEVRVSDTGIGIAKEDQEKLFKEFTQVDGSITRKFGGTGLGLAISKRLVEMHGGTIGFESTVGQGSKFHFSVPRARHKSRPAFTPPIARRTSSVAPTKSQRQTQIVLVIDADAAAGRLVSGMLEEAGIRSVVADRLTRARELLSRSFDAVIVDPDVDDASRADVMRFIAEEAKAAVVISTLRREEIGWDIPGCPYLAKPLDRGELVEAVRGLIARRGGKRRALVIDPSSVDGAAVQTLLEREGFEVIRVENAADARSRTAQSRFDISVCEAVMEDADGVALVEELARTLPVLVLTSQPPDGEPLRRLQTAAAFVARKGTLSRSAFARHVAQALQQQRRATPRILAVDDNDQNLRLIGAVLARKGYEMIEARDATSAVALARAERPSAILMDVMLPDIDGLEATRRLKSDALTRDIPVIAVSAKAMSGDDSKALEAGCCDYVTKPIDSSRLLRALDEALHPVAPAANA